MFKSEKDLVEAFKSFKTKFLMSVLKRSISRHFLIEEFDSHRGVTDVLLGTYKPYLSKKKNREVINPNWLGPLWSLKKNQTITMNEFIGFCGVSKTTAIKILQEYIKAQFFEEIGKCEYKIVNNYELIVREIVSIEAKLKNWRQALKQAQRYKRFSNFSFVLLDERFAGPARKEIDQFKSHNIGLVTMNKDGYKLQFSPKKMRFKKNETNLKINEMAYSFFRDEFSVY